MSWLIGIFLAILFWVFVAGWIGTAVFVIGLVAFLESGSLLAGAVALVGLGIIFAID
jgi:hypothetical protein